MFLIWFFWKNLIDFLGQLQLYFCHFFGADIAANNYLLGVGFDKLEGLLNSCFKDNYGSNFYNEQHYLSHNYFLYILLSSGIFGLLIYLFYVYKIFIVSIRINSFLLSICLLNILILSFTEDFFLRQYGLFFFSLIFIAFIIQSLLEIRNNNFWS